MIQSGNVGWAIEDPAVIEGIGQIPRHRFVTEEFLDEAIDNHPLPIGCGQPISQAHIVALMTQELRVSPGARVLEIGTGSDYQATVLAELGVEVYTIGIIGALAETAEAARDELGYTDVHVSNGDGTEGWPEQAPFDAIIVTAAPDHVPPPLLAQRGVGGGMIIPVGPVGACQVLWRITRTGEESYESVSLGGAQFVPLTRQDESP